MNKTVFFSVLTLCVTVLAMYSVDKVTLNNDLRSQRYAYQRCMDKARDNYKDQWAYKCKQQKEDENCGLNGIIADMLDSDWDENKQECLSIFKERAYYIGE